LACISTHTDALSEPERSVPFDGGRDEEKGRKQRGNRRLQPERESGEAGIRTLGTLARTLVFETSTIGHSVTSPRADRRRANHTPPPPSFPDGCAAFRRPASVSIPQIPGAPARTELPRPIRSDFDKNQCFVWSEKSAVCRIAIKKVRFRAPPNLRLREDTNPNRRIKADLRASFDRLTVL
jgi:hypothetical protein